jgi:LPS export ABC transporter protein LptC
MVRFAIAGPGYGSNRAAWAGYAVALAIFVGCGSEENLVPSPERTDLPTQEVRNFTLEESDAGHRDWILSAKYAATYGPKGVIQARDVQIDFYDSQGRKYSHLVAREGEVHQPGNDMEARGNVVVTTTEGVRIETSSLRYLNQQNKITSDAFVRLTRHGDVVTGIGFESDPSLTHFSLKREVRAQVQSSPGGGLRFQERGRP